MMLRRTLEGASKCALRDLRREEWRAATDNIVSIQLCISIQVVSINILLETLAIVMDVCRENWVSWSSRRWLLKCFWNKENLGGVHKVKKVSEKCGAHGRYRSTGQDESGVFRRSFSACILPTPDQVSGISETYWSVHLPSRLFISRSAPAVHLSSSFLFFILVRNLPIDPY